MILPCHFIALDPSASAIVMRAAKCFCCFYSLCWFSCDFAPKCGRRRAILCMDGHHALCHAQSECTANSHFIWFHPRRERKTRKLMLAEIELLKSRNRGRRYSPAGLMCYCLPSAYTIAWIVEFGLYAFMQRWIFTGIFALCRRRVFILPLGLPAAYLLRHLFFRKVITTEHWLRKVF